MSVKNIRSIFWTEEVVVAYRVCYQTQYTEIFNMTLFTFDFQYAVPYLTSISNIYFVHSKLACNYYIYYKKC